MNFLWIAVEHFSLMELIKIFLIGKKKQHKYYPILAFNEFKDEFLDQGVGISRSDIYWKGLASVALFSIVSFQGLPLLFSTIGMIILYLTDYHIASFTFTRKRIIIEKKKQKSRRKKLAVFFLLISGFSIIYPLNIEMQINIMTFLIPPLYPALLFYLVAVFYPSILPILPAIGLFLFSITTFWILWFAYRDEHEITSMPSSHLKAILLSRTHGLNKKGYFVILLVMMLQLIMNILIKYTVTPVFNLIAFFLFPLTIFVVARFRNEEKYALVIYNKKGMPISTEIIFEKSNLSRVKKAFSYYLNYPPSYDETFPKSIIDSTYFSKFPTGKFYIQKKFYKKSFLISRSLSILLFIIVILIDISRGDTLFSFFIFFIATIGVFYVSNFLMTKLVYNLTNTEDTHYLLFSDYLVAFISQNKIFLVTLASLGGMEIVKQFNTNLYEFNNLGGKKINWKLLVAYVLGLLFFGLISQFVRFGFISLYGLMKITSYFFTLILQKSFNFILNHRFIILYFIALFWLALTLVLPRIMLLIRSDLIIHTLPKSDFEFQSDELSGSIFINNILTSFKMGSMNTQNNRPVAVHATIELKNISDKPLTLFIGAHEKQFSLMPNELKRCRIKSIVKGLDITIHISSDVFQTTSLHFKKKGGIVSVENFLKAKLLNYVIRL